jgi:hypothetical protein
MRCVARECVAPRGFGVALLDCRSSSTRAQPRTRARTMRHASKRAAQRRLIKGRWRSSLEGKIWKWMNFLTTLLQIMNFSFLHHRQNAATRALVRAVPVAAGAYRARAADVSFVSFARASAAHGQGQREACPPPTRPAPVKPDIPHAPTRPPAAIGRPVDRHRAQWQRRRLGAQLLWHQLCGGGQIMDAGALRGRL